MNEIDALKREIELLKQLVEAKDALIAQLKRPLSTKEISDIFNDGTKRGPQQSPPWPTKYINNPSLECSLKMSSTAPHKLIYVCKGPNKG